MYQIYIDYAEKNKISKRMFFLSTPFRYTKNIERKLLEISPRFCDIYKFTVDHGPDLLNVLKCPQTKTCKIKIVNTYFHSNLFQIIKIIRSA